MSTPPNRWEVVKGNPTYLAGALSESEGQAIRWHSPSSARSSQVFCISAFGSLRHLSDGQDILQTLLTRHFPDVGLTGPWKLDLEFSDRQVLDESGRVTPTSVDVSFVQAFEKAKAADWNTIDDLSPLSSGAALRLKTLHLYFPTDVLPISSKQHLRHFLRLLDRPEADDRSLDVVRLNRALLDVVRQRSEFQGWSTAEVERFFYDWADTRDDSLGVEHRFPDADAPF